MITTCGFGYDCCILVGCYDAGLTLLVDCLLRLLLSFGSYVYGLWGVVGMLFGLLCFTGLLVRRLR